MQNQIRHDILDFLLNLYERVWLYIKTSVLPINIYKIIASGKLYIHITFECIRIYAGYTYNKHVLNTLYFETIMIIKYQIIILLSINDNINSINYFTRTVNNSIYHYINNEIIKTEKASTIR